MPSLFVADELLRKHLSFFILCVCVCISMCMQVKFLQQPAEGNRSSSASDIPLTAESLPSSMNSHYTTYTDILSKEKRGLKTILNMNIFIS